MAYDERVESLLLDYHLDQLSEPEAEEVRRALPESTECRERLEELSRILDLVPLSTSPITPPAYLKDRVLAAAGERVASRDASHDPPPSEREQPPIVSSGVRLRSLAPLLVAAALMVAVLAPLAASYLQLREENQRLEAEVRRLDAQDGSLTVAPVQGTNRASGARGTVVLDLSTGKLAFAAYDLPPAPGGHAYHAWLIGDVGPQDLGEMEPDAGGDVTMTGETPDPRASYEALEVTVEPEGGEPVKTGPIYLRGKL